MKKLILIQLALIGWITLFSQELRYSDLTPDANGRHQYHGERLITSYISKDGTAYKVGDKLKIGTPSSNKTFAYITNESTGREILGAFAGANTPGREQLKADASNSIAEIATIAINGSKRNGWFALIMCKGKQDNWNSNYGIQLENAIAAGEIKTDVLSSDEALSELKKCKDKLDLGLITQQKYDSIKAILIKYIK